MQFTKTTIILAAAGMAYAAPNPDLFGDIGNSIAAAGSQGVAAASSAANQGVAAASSAANAAGSAIAPAASSAGAAITSAGGQAVAAASSAGTAALAHVTSAFAAVPTQYSSLVNQGMSQCNANSECSAWAATASRIANPTSNPGPMITPAMGMLAGVAGLAMIL